MIEDPVIIKNMMGNELCFAYRGYNNKKKDLS